MLIRLQLPNAPADAQQILQNSIHRVHSIAAIHEILSQRGFRLVDIKEVLGQIVRMTAETMTAPHQNIRVEVIGEPLLMPTRAATNLVLIVNELLQNALEHAFKDQTEGQVTISLGRAPGEHLILVRDNGRGFPANYLRGLGLEIVETLLHEELHGRLRLHPAAPGTEITLRFPQHSNAE
jgi:two-component sensor histidine kinase